MKAPLTIARQRQQSRQSRFLACFAQSGNLMASANQASVSRQIVYYWRDTSPSFAKKLATAANTAFRPPALSIPTGTKRERGRR